MQEQLVVPERVALLADVKYKTQSGDSYAYSVLILWCAATSVVNQAPTDL
jgi:hypothetical protein